MIRRFAPLTVPVPIAVRIAVPIAVPISWLVGALSISCVSAPALRHPEVVELPDDWTGRDGEGELEAGPWWTSFGDPNLDHIVAEALVRNYDLEAAVARLAAAVAEARIAGADLYPRAGVSFDVGRQKMNFIGLPVPGGDDVLTTRTTSHALSFSTSWEIDLWGRIRAGQAAALADVQAADADLEAARQSLAARVAILWFTALEAKEQFELAEATVESYRDSSEWIEERYRLGLRQPLDLRLNLSDLAAAEAVVERRREELDVALRQLEILLGRYPGANLGLTEAMPPMPPEVPAGLPAELVARRPDVARAERQLAASDSRVKQAKAALLPRISLTASGGASSDDLGDLLSGDFSMWSLGANLLQPIFEGGRLRAGVALAEARTDEAAAAYASTTLTAFAEVESALAAEGTLADREDRLEEASQQAEEARRLAEERYRAGLEGFLIYLESQRRAFTARSQFLLVRRLRLDARARLHLALGGGFESPESRAIDESTD